MAEALTGWELDDDIGDLLQADDHAAIAAFIAAYGPLAAFNSDAAVVAVIRRYHPTLNCEAGDEVNPSDDHYSMRIAFFARFMKTFYVLPKTLTYERLALIPQPGGMHVDFAITTKEFGTITTNASELSSQLAPDFKPRPEPEMISAFQNLKNARPKPRPKVTSTEVTLPSLGVLLQSEFEDWWRTTVLVPMIGQSLPLTVMDFNPDDPDQAGRIDAFDAAIAEFLALGPDALRTAAPRVLANCHEYIEAVGEEDWNRDMAQCVDADQIWRFVALQELQVVYHKATDSVFVTLAGECDWEEEHGLQLVFRDGTTLTRVSAQDGHPVD